MPLDRKTSCKHIPTRFSLQAHPNPSGNWSEWLLSSLYIPNPMAEEVPNKPLDYYTCPFKTSKIDRYLLAMMAILMFVFGFPSPPLDD